MYSYEGVRHSEALIHKAVLVEVYLVSCSTLYADMVFLVGKDHYLLVLVNMYVNESPTDYQPMQEHVRVCSAG